jgi:hypothetical protein
MEDRSGDYYGGGTDMHESSGGEWVRWDDAQMLMLRAAAQVASLGRVGNNPADADALKYAHAILWDAAKPGPDCGTQAVLEAVRAMDAALMFDGQPIGHVERMQELRACACMLRCRFNLY